MKKVLKRVVNVINIYDIEAYHILGIFLLIRH